MYQKAVTFTNEMSDALFRHDNTELMTEFYEIQKTLFKFINKVDWSISKPLVTVPYREADLKYLKEEAGYTDVTYDEKTGSISCKTENGTSVIFGPTKMVMQP
jgi:hypothetical protein